MCPLRKLDLGHQFRLKPMNFSKRFHWPVERVHLGLQVLQQRPYLGKCLPIEAATRLPHMDETALLVVQPKHYRSKMFARALRIGVAPDNALNPLCDFDLEPLAAAPFFVTTL